MNAAMAQTALGGILPAIVTPFDDEGRFQESSFSALLEFVYAAGVDGIYVCGQTGEGLQQSPEQRKRVAEVAVRLSSPGKQVIVHVGAASTAVAVELVRHAEKTGAAAVSSLPPAGAYSFAETLEYYRQVASASSLPFLVYYFPAGSAAISPLAQIEELLALPNVVGLKFTDMDLYKLSRLKKSRVVVFNGYDEILAAGLLMGADGGIGSFYNVVPEWFAGLYAAARAGDWMRARAIQESINDLIAAGLRYPVHSAVKVMLAWRGIDCGRPLPPRRPLTSAEETELRAWLDRSGIGKR